MKPMAYAGPASNGTGQWSAGTLLAMLSPSSRSVLLDMGVAHRYEHGQAIIRELDDSSYVVLLCRAVVKITTCLENGRMVFLGIRVGGDLVGELAALSGEPRSATVTACGDARVRLIQSAEFRRYLHAFPDAHLALTRMVMHRLRWANQRRIDYGGYLVFVRLARVLNELADAYGRQVPDGITFDVSLTQRELGALVGAEEDTARRELRRLRDRGVIRMGYRSITILDREALRKIAFGLGEHL
jgi:CRP/FNR family transcriptional regulator, cyclic AMP receptor protein